MDTHKFEVRELSKQVRFFYEHKKPFRIYHGGSHSYRAMHDPKSVIHTSHLHHILDVNKSSQFALVEPNVSMEKLLEETLKHGLMPPVVPSFPGITVGGSFSGTVGSSSSFEHGFFDQSVLWIEALLPDGTITRASRTRNSELLDGMVGSLGTLGIVTLLQIRLVPSATWVELSYLPIQNDTEAIKTLEKLSQDPKNNFLEAVLYGKDSSEYGVIAVGKLSAASHHPQIILNNPMNDWFYDHVLQVCGTTECVPIKDYLFRHDRGALNLGKFCFGKLPLNNWTRWLADPALHFSSITRTAQALHWADHLFIQDLVVPQDSTSKMFNFIEINIGSFPLLLTPILRSSGDHVVYINISFRGSTPSTIHDMHAFKLAHRQLERQLQQLGGFKWLYSRNFYTEAEFWETYDKKRYDQLREKYHAEYVQSVWKKSEAGDRKEVTPRPKGFWDRIWAKAGVVAMSQHM